MTPRAFQRFALSLPEAHEEPHFERTSFRVKNKIFATMTPDGAEAMIRVGEPGLLHSLLSDHADVFFSYGGWTLRNGSLGIRLAKAKDAVIESLMVESWKHVAPKRLVAAREGEGEGSKGEAPEKKGRKGKGTKRKPAR